MLSNPTRGALGFTLAFLMAAPTFAGGYQVQQQGANASGRAGAFVAQADDASATFYNPAAVGQLEGWNIYVGGALIPSIDSTFTGAAGTSDTEGVTEWAPAVYVTGPIGEHYAFALGTFSPFALHNEWGVDAVTASEALVTDWTTREYNLSFIAKLGNEWSVAVGFEWVRLEIEEFTSAYDFTQLSPFLFPSSEPYMATRNYTLSGDKAGLNAAVHYKGATGNRFGLSFRSKKIIHLSGNERWQDVSEATFTPTTNLVDPAGCAFNPTFCPMGAAFTDSPAESTIVLPWSVQLGFGQEGRGKWDWEVDLLATFWEDVDSLDIAVADKNGVIASSFSTVSTTFDLNRDEAWGNTLALFGGADYNISEAHAIRFGLGFDQTPVDEEIARATNPDADKLGLTAGYGWSGLDGKIKIDAFAQYWSYADLEPTGATGINGVTNGTFETTAISAGASFQYRF